MPQLYYYLVPVLYILFPYLPYTRYLHGLGALCNLLLYSVTPTLYLLVITLLYAYTCLVYNCLDHTLT